MFSKLVKFFSFVSKDQTLYHQKVVLNMWSILVDKKTSFNFAT